MAKSIELNIPADYVGLNQLGEAVSDFVKGAFDPALAFGIRLAVHELCSNIIDHAYRGAAPEESIRLCLSVSGDTFRVEVTDRGEMFNPQEVTWPLNITWQCESVAEQPEYRLLHVDEPSLEQSRGRGMYLMQEIMSEIIYAPGRCQNRWRLVRRADVEVGQG